MTFDRGIEYKLILVSGERLEAEVWSKDSTGFEVTTKGTRRRMFIPMSRVAAVEEIKR